MYADFERHVERVPTGMIDDPIMGGIPKGSVVLLIGDPKSGKTTFISQFKPVYSYTANYGIFYNLYSC